MTLKIRKFWVWVLQKPTTNTYHGKSSNEDRSFFGFPKSIKYILWWFLQISLLPEECDKAEYEVMAIVQIAGSQN